METAQERMSDFMSKLLRGARECVHLQAVSLRNCPPWLAKSGCSRVYPQVSQGWLGVYGVHDLVWRTWWNLTKVNF